MRERRVVIVGYDEATLLDIACVTSSLHAANRVGASPAYRVSLATPGGHAISCDSGILLHGQQSLERSTGPLDTLIVSGGFGHEAAAADPRIVGHIRRLARESRRVASVCTGASVLAAAGLLEGKRATTHWRFAAQLAARHPQVVVDPDPIYIRDGRLGLEGWLDPEHGNMFRALIEQLSARPPPPMASPTPVAHRNARRTR